MSYRYVCRCCGMKIAQFDQPHLSDVQLGLDSLTPEEREHIITRDVDGDTVIRITCDYCRDALDRNPELSLVGNPLQ